MQNTSTTFYGKQSGEKILSHIKPHKISLYISIVKIILAASAISTLGFIISSQLSSLPTGVKTYPLLAGVIFGVVGIVGQVVTYSKTIAYITNRRVVRFSAHTPFATSVRSLTWDQAVKAKTLPPNPLFKMLMIGAITVHSSSTISAIDTKTTHNITTNDDIEITNAYYYKDIGNYIEKIIYTFKNEPDKVKDLKPFIAKPKGKRY